MRKGPPMIKKLLAAVAEHGDSREGESVIRRPG